MSFVRLKTNIPLEVHAGSQVFLISESGDGGLYIEGEEAKDISVSVNDDSEFAVNTVGLWVTISVVPTAIEDKS